MSEYVTVWQDGQPTTLRWAAPVVRCRDCRCMHRMDGRCVCVRWQFATTPDGFCAWGERTKTEQEGL